MKKKKVNLIILFSTLLVVLFFTLKDNFYDIINAILKVNIFIFLFAILIYILSIVFKSLSLYILLREYNNDYKFKYCLSLTFIGQFLNGITPFQSGGQPFIIYLLKKDGMKVSNSTNVMIKDFLSYQISLVLLGTIIILVNYIKYNNINLFVLLGYLVNLFVLIMILIISSKHFKNKLQSVLLKIFNKVKNIKIFKSLNNIENDIKISMNNFANGGKSIKNNKRTFIISLLNNSVYLILLYCVPYFIFLSLGCNTITYTNSFMMITFVMLISNFIPIPGASGGIEFSFIKLFEQYDISSHLLFSSMLLWRFVTYILGMLIGYVLLFIKKGCDLK